MSQMLCTIYYLRQFNECIDNVVESQLMPICYIPSLKCMLPCTPATLRLPSTELPAPLLHS